MRYNSTRAATEGFEHITVHLKTKGGFTFEAVCKARFRLNEIEFTVSSLPLVVTNAVETKFPGATINSATQVLNAKGKPLFFTLTISFKGKKQEVDITAAGKIL